MAAAGRVVAETIAHVGEQLEPGITTGELDRIADEHIRSLGGVPTSQDYRGYPKAICISPNDMVVHGIPGAYEVGGRRPDHDRRRRHARRLHRRQRLHLPGRGRLGRGAAAARRRPRRARSRNRPGPPGQPRRRHLGRRPAARRRRRLLGRPQPRRPRRRPLLPRGSAHPELRPARPRPAPQRGDDARDRADDHGRPSRGLRPRRRMVDFDRGRLARRPLRAHRRDHGRGAADPDGCGDPSAILTGRAA